MFNKKSLRLSLTSIFIVAQLFLSIVPNVSANEILESQINVQTALEEHEPNIGQKKEEIIGILNNQTESNSIQKEIFKKDFIYNYSQIVNNTPFREESLFALSALHTNFGNNDFLRNNDYFFISKPVIENGNLNNNFSESFQHFSTSILETELSTILKPNQTLEEQALVIEKYYLIDGLSEIIISLGNYYLEIAAVDAEEERLASEEEVIDSQEKTIISDTEIHSSTEVFEESVEEDIQPFSRSTNQAKKENNIIAEQTVNYMAKIIYGNYKATSLPPESPDAKEVGTSNSYLNHTYKIVGEATTAKGTYVKFYANGEHVWLDKKAIQPEMMTNIKTTNYYATITRGTDTLNSLPWGVPDFETYGKTDRFLGTEVVVNQETTTPRAHWVFVSLFDGTDLGWMDIKGISKRGEEPILSSNKVNYQAKITGRHTLDTAPWGSKGYQTIERSDKYVGKTVYVMEEAVTHRAKWAKIYINGKNVWIDIKGLEPEKISSSRSIKYDAEVIRGTDTINSLPWGVKGFNTVGSTKEFLNKKVTVIEEAVTPRATWVKIQYNGVLLGWIDQKAVKLIPNYVAPKDTWISSTTTNYQAKVTGNHTLDSLPWGIEGYKTVGRTTDILGRTVTIVEEAITSRAKWVKFFLNGQYVWMDIKGIEPETILSSKTVNYQATISRQTDTINSLPWGVKGYQTVATSSNYYGKIVTVVAEAVTPRTTWAKIQVNGNVLGWIDTKGLRKEQKVIFIDPGHGGNDPGATYFGVKEKDLNLKVSLKLRNALVAKGYRVVMSRTTDISLDYKTERSRLANASGADIFISLHHNAYPWNGNVNGIETLVYEYEPDYPSKINQNMHNNPERVAKSTILARNIHNQLVSTTSFTDRGLLYGSYAVLRETAIPAVLLELGFMSNKAELDKLVNDAHQNKSVDAIVRGIDAYFNN